MCPALIGATNKFSISKPSAEPENQSECLKSGSDSLWTAAEDAGVVEQGVEGKLHVEVALHDRFFD